MQGDAAFTVLKITVHFVRSDVGSHGNNGNSGTILSDVHGSRHTIQSGHDYIHKDHVEVVAADSRDPAISVCSILLYNSQLAVSAKQRGYSEV